MKLLIVLSLIACGYAAKLDRAYLPPSSAATAGGSPGSLNAPAGPAPSGFAQPAGTTGFGQPASSGPSFGKSTSGPAFGAQLSGSTGFGAPSAQYGQPGSPAGSLDPGFSQVAQNFGNQGGQEYQRNQPQRAQASADQNAEILRYDNQNDGETFSYAFETSNGIAAEESGVATNGVQAQGGYSYSGDDGQAYRVTYTADENGYQPQGDHLPTPYPIPEEILKSIELNAQAAAAGTQEGAYNPNEDNTGSTAQQYRKNAPTSYGQGASGSSSFSQAQGPSQLYGAPNAGSRPQSGSQDFKPQGPSQQYGAPNAGVSSTGPSNNFGKPQVPSQYDGTSQARPNSFGQSQGSFQQFGAPSQPGSSGNSLGFVPLGPTSSGFRPSGPAPQPMPKQYQSSQFGSPSTARLQGPTQGGQAQGESGYQYDKPQVSSFGQGTNGRPSTRGPAGQYRPQNGAAQPSAPQGSFSSPNSNAGYPSGPAQRSFGPSSAAGSQGSFGPTSGPNSAFGTGSKGPNSFGSSTGYASQGSFGSSGPKSPGTFAPSAGSGQSSFGPSAGSSGFGRTQGSFPSVGAQGGMSNSGYAYNRPGSQPGLGSQQPRGSSNAPTSGPGQTFGGPRQPPSFSEQEGYKY